MNPLKPQTTQHHCLMWPDAQVSSQQGSFTNPTQHLSLYFKQNDLWKMYYRYYNIDWKCGWLAFSFFFFFLHEFMHFPNPHCTIKLNFQPHPFLNCLFSLPQTWVISKALSLLLASIYYFTVPAFQGLMPSPILFAFTPNYLQLGQFPFCYPSAGKILSLQVH